MEGFETISKVLPQGAAVSAVIIVVILFLRTSKDLLAFHIEQLTKIQEQYQQTILTMAHAHQEAQRITRGTYKEQLERIVTVFVDRHNSIMDKLNVLIETYTRISTETVSTLGNLKDSVKDLERRVDDKL